MLEKINNIIYDTNYSKLVKNGGYPKIKLEVQSKDGKKKKKEGIFDKFFNTLFGVKSSPSHKNKDGKKGNDGKKKEDTSRGDEKLVGKSLTEQIKIILNKPDDEYNDKMLTPDIRKYLMDTENSYVSSLSDYKAHISPSYWEINSNSINISGTFGRTYYATNYPSYIDFLRTRDILGFFGKWDINWYIYPAENAGIQAMLKRRATQLKAEIGDAANRGITIDTEVEIEYKDVESIRQKLATREERYFQTSFYTTIYHEEADRLNETCKKFEQKIGGVGIKIKPATHRMDEGFSATLPLLLDDLGIFRSMVTTSLAGGFPFISNDLIENSGILYGINLHTGSLVVFDRYSKKLPNSNSVVLATSGAGKSFTVKLEILRYLLMGTDVIVIDPENEYKGLIEKVGGTYVNIAINSNQYLNPFDLPPKIEDIDYGIGDLLRSQIMNLIGLISVLLGGLEPEEEAMIDKAIQATYALKDINFETEDPASKSPPIMEDLLNMLEGMEGGERLAMKMSKYVTGTFGNLFNNKTNIDLDTGLTVFSIRDLEDALKTPAMFNILNFIWTKIRSHKRKRLVVVDEAWIMLQNEISGNFLFGLIKRARKYGVGVTTITQDVEDFLKSQYGKPIVSNSSMQILLKQSPASIKSLEKVFGLSEAEKQKLVASNVGEGLFFAGNQHVALKILASPYEKDFITTDI